MYFNDFTPAELDDLVLCCPCGGTYLHHTRVTVCQRMTHGLTPFGDPRSFGMSEEAGDYVTLAVNATDIVHNPDAPSAFDGRRSQVDIDFVCEQCDQRMTLVVGQHKGQTMIGWRPCNARNESKSE